MRGRFGATGGKLCALGAITRSGRPLTGLVDGVVQRIVQLVAALDLS
jgi:hypothetical protein